MTPFRHKHWKVIMDSDTANSENIFLPVKVNHDIRPASSDLSKGERRDITPDPQCLSQHMSDFL